MPQIHGFSSIVSSGKNQLPTLSMPPPETAANQHQSTGASPSPHDSPGRTPWLTLLLLLASGTAIRLLYLAHKPFWFDESFSVEVARISWGNFLHLLWWREANMSLYYVLLRIWLQFGYSEFYIRSLSVVISAATVPAIYWLARLLYDRRVALIAAALFTFNAYSVRYSQEARSYALFLLLATLSSGFFIALVREPVRRNRIGYVLISILAVYAHFYALLLVAAHWLALGWLRSGEASTDRTRLSAQWRRIWTTIGVAVLPLLVFVAKTGAGPIRWIQRPGFHDLFVFFVHLTGATGGRCWPSAPSPALRRWLRWAGRSGRAARLGRPGAAVSAAVAVLPGSAHGSAIVRPSGLSGALHDLLPARTADSGSGRPGAAAAIVAARGRSSRDPAA